MEGRSKRADRLLLRVSDRLDRSHAVQRHDGRSRRAQRHSTAVRAIRIGLPPVRAALSPGHARRPAHAIAGGGGGFALSKGPQYDDVRDAWRHYLEHDNRGRGVVLIGHSQGSFILTELIRQEIDGKPVQSRLVSALLLGATFAVPQRQGRWRIAPTDSALSQAGADRMRRDLRVVPLDVASAREHAIRQGHRAWHGRGVHQPRGARRGQRSAAARISPPTAG